MRIILILLITTLFSCASNVPKSNTVEQRIINEAIEAHGGKLYDNANFSFEFRKKQYTFKQENGFYEYTMRQSKNDRNVYYFLSNDQFIYTINDEVQNLSEKDVTRYGNSLNSVIYFAQLPYRLNDPAVIKSYKGVATIKGQTYHAIEVRFTEAGGGTDHEDIYYYWINQKTKTMDYLAYSFHVNGGGIRFRAAFNPSVVRGIRFQDYENYKADLGTPFDQLPGLYERGKLKLLSKIETENIKQL